MSEKKNLLARLSSYLDLPSEGLPGGFSMLLSGDGELCVRGTVGILSYDEAHISIRVGKCEVSIEGEELFCAELTSEKMVITGTVTALFLKKEGRNAV